MAEKLQHFSVSLLWLSTTWQIATSSALNTKGQRQTPAHTDIIAIKIRAMYLKSASARINLMRFNSENDTSSRISHVMANFFWGQEQHESRLAACVVEWWVLIASSWQFSTWFDSVCLIISACHQYSGNIGPPRPRLKASLLLLPNLYFLLFFQNSLRPREV